MDKAESKIDPYVLDNSDFEWNYIESEGKDSVRYDWYYSGQEASLWVFSSGSIEGSAPKKYESAIEKIPGTNTKFAKFL